VQVLELRHFSGARPASALSARGLPNLSRSAQARKLGGLELAELAHFLRWLACVNPTATVRRLQAGIWEDL
jgi:hypothetical protein